MVAYSERQRVRRLLAEAITMLCKSSLSYKFGFSVEGLIGITLDDSQVILVNINEEITDKSWRENTGTKITSSPSDDPIDLRMGENKHISASAGSSTQHHTNPSDHTQRSDHRDRPARCGKRESTRSRLSNGHGSKKRRVLESPLSTRIKKEDEEEGSKGESGGRSGEGWTPDVVPPPPHSPESVEGQQQDVIFIKDDDSDSDTSVEGDSAPASHHHGNQVPHSPSPGDEDGGGKVLQTSIKVEDEGEEAGRRGSSPIEVTYEAGMWATETAVDGQASTQLHPGQASLHPSPLKSNLTQTPSNEADIGAQPNAQVYMVYCLSIAFNYLIFPKEVF